MRQAQGGSNFLPTRSRQLYSLHSILDFAVELCAHDHNWTVDCWVVLGVLVVFWLW
jgi:hypothetical protein